MPDWSSYFARLGPAPISIAVDLSFGSRAPVVSMPCACTVAVVLLEPDDAGMTTGAEYRALQSIEEALAEALEPAGIVEVGRVTGGGMRTFHYYGPAGCELAEPVAAVMRAHPAYRYRAVAADDPHWAIYSGYLYPDDAQLAFATDMKALQALLDAGDDFEQPRPIEHTIRFDDRAKSAVFARAMANQGYAVDAAPDRVRCSKTDTLDPFKITEMRTCLTTLAEEFGGWYDGWAAPVRS